MAEKRKREEDLEGNTSPQAQHSTARTSLTVSQRATQSTRHRCPIPFFARAKSSGEFNYAVWYAKTMHNIAQ